MSLGMKRLDRPHDSRRLPPLTMIRAFDAVARLSSIRAAALELGVTHTAVSRHLHNLEAWLGTKLMVTGPRGSQLTEEGRAYFEVIAKAFDLISAATDELRPSNGQSVLTVWCAPGLAARWLTPRLQKLQTEMTGVDIVLKASSRRPDFARFEADVEIRWETGTETEWRFQELIRPRLIPVASPSFAANYRITHARDLARLPLIHEESRDQWRNWLQAAGAVDMSSLHGPRLGAASLALDAAVAGQGVALAPSPIATEDIASGRLVELLQTDIRTGAYILVAPKGRWTSPLVSRFRTWVLAAIEALTHD